MLQGPFSFSPGCAHRGRGPQYPLKTGVSTQNCMTSIVAYTGHSTSCGKPLNWTQLVSSISSPSLTSSSFPPFSYLPSLFLFPHVFTELQSYSGIDGKICAFLSLNCLVRIFLCRTIFVMEFNFIYKIKENEFCIWCAHPRFNKLLYLSIYCRCLCEWILACQPQEKLNDNIIISSTMIPFWIYLIIELCKS